MELPARVLYIHGIIVVIIPICLEKENVLRYGMLVEITQTFIINLAVQYYYFCGAILLYKQRKDKNRNLKNNFIKKLFRKERESPNNADNAENFYEIQRVFYTQFGCSTSIHAIDQRYDRAFSSRWQRRFKNLTIL